MLILILIVIRCCRKSGGRIINKYRIIIPIILLSILALFVVFGLNYKETASSSLPTVEKGNMILPDWDLSADGNLKLDGEWEFYWDQLLSPGEFDHPNAELTGYYPVPLYWTKYPNLDLPSKGSATYRLVVETQPENETLSIKTPEVYTEYSLYINGHQIAGSQVGSVNTYLSPDIYTFMNDQKQIELVLQIKNSSHANAGIGQSFILGTTTNIYKRKFATDALDISILAIVFFVGLYHLIQYIYRRKEIALLYFAVLCVLVVVRGILSNETYLMHLIPGLPFLAGSRLITSVIPLFTAFILLYVNELYKDRTNKKFLAILLSANAIYFILALTTPTPFYSSLFNIYLVSVAFAGLLVIVVAMKGVMEKDKESFLFLTGSFGPFIGALNDMLYYNQVIDTGYYFTMGLAFFAVVQSAIIAGRFSRIIREKEEMYQKLLDTNLAFMQAQIKPHFIYNALSTISYLATANPPRAKEMILDFSDYLRGSFRFDNETGFVELSKELELVEAYLSIEKERFGERLEIEYNIKEDPTVRIPNLCIQPLVENAVKHGLMDRIEGGKVTISALNEGTHTHIIVEDNGTGMDEKKIGTLLNNRTAIGVGVQNINNRLKVTYGKGLIINSTINLGTRVEIMIPKEMKKER